MSANARRRSSLSDKDLLQALRYPAVPCALSPPPYLRGTLAAFWQQKASLSALVTSAMDTVQQLHGFHSAENGAVALAKATLLSHLTGGGGAPLLPQDAIAALHENVFENYNNWSLMVGARCVWSARLGPPLQSEVQLSGPALPPWVPPAPPYASGADARVRLSQLCLHYAIRAEAANLVFMPELCAWLFHQMSVGCAPPSAEGRAAWRAGAEASGAAPYTSFFSHTTIAPLYAVLKQGARRTEAPPATSPTSPAAPALAPATPLKTPAAPTTMTSMRFSG